MNGLIPPDALEQLLALVPQLKRGGKFFWDIMGAVPIRQRGAFREPVLSALRELPLGAARSSVAEVTRAYLVASYLRDPEVARVALSQIDAVPPYVFPPKDPAAWGIRLDEADLAITRGAQGMLAQTIVTYGDAATVRAFRQRVLIAEGRRCGGTFGLSALA